MNGYLARLATRSMTRRPTAIAANIPPSFPPRLGRHGGREPGADAQGGEPAQPQSPAAEPVADPAALNDLPPDRVTRAALPLAASEATAESQPSDGAQVEAWAASPVSVDRRRPHRDAESEPPAEPVASRPGTAEVVRVEPVQAPWQDEPASQPSGTTAHRTPPVPARPRDASGSGGTSQPPTSVESVGSAPGDRADSIAPRLSSAASSSGLPQDTSARNTPDIERPDRPYATGPVIVAAVPDLVPLAAAPAPSPPPLTAAPASDPAPIDVHIGTIEIVAEPAPPAPAAPPGRERPGLDAYAHLRSYDWDDWHE